MKLDLILLEMFHDKLQLTVLWITAIYKIT
jgi:hypothetical protein